MGCGLVKKWLCKLIMTSGYTNLGDVSLDSCFVRRTTFLINFVM